MILREEKNEDHDKVYALVQKAFEHAEHRDGKEQDLVCALRKSEAFLPSLSLVAEIDHRIVGHILFTKIKIGEKTQVALAPLSVLPDYQRQGVGSALVEAGHRKAKELGFEYSVVLGSEKYYPKFGYQKAGDFGIYPPFEVPSENFMAVDLQGNSEKNSGVVEYPKEFGS